jgi:hypothetical protein
MQSQQLALTTHGELHRRHSLCKLIAASGIAAAAVVGFSTPSFAAVVPTAGGPGCENRTSETTGTDAGPRFLKARHLITAVVAVPG